jgi:hypothetical protein
LRFFSLTTTPVFQKATILNDCPKIGVHYNVPGSGWNNFLTSDALGSISLAPGMHQLSFKVLSSDHYGVEIDTVELVREK